MPCLDLVTIGCTFVGGTIELGEGNGKGEEGGSRLGDGGAEITEVGGADSTRVGGS